MNFKKLLPTDFNGCLDQAVLESLQVILMRTNFTPGVRHVIGWRGLANVLSNMDGWTARIKDVPGVYGLGFEGADALNDWINGRFSIYYFPDPGEELAESFSIEAGVYAQQDFYKEHVRSFLLHPELCSLFNIGALDLCMNKSGASMALALEGPSRHRVISADGVYLNRDGRRVQLLSPGQCDQDLPSYDLCLKFFNVLAASASFNLQEPPSYLRSLGIAGSETFYDSKGRSWKEKSDHVKVNRLFLGFGNGNFKKLCTAYEPDEISAQDECEWAVGGGIPPEFTEAPWWSAHNISNFKTIDKQIMGIDDRPQLIMLSGFLGAGKTSFLQNFIEHQVSLNRFVAVIQNEIGETGVDGKILDHDYSVVEIDEGCVCCTLSGALKNALHQIMSSFHPDYIVLETTGLANPFNLLDEIAEVEELVRFDCVTTVVDGPNILKYIDDYEVAENQIKAADIMLLNKTDLISQQEAKDVERKLRTLNPHAPILNSVKGDVNPSLLYGTDFDDSDRQGEKDKKAVQSVGSDHSHQRDNLFSIKKGFPEPVDKDGFIKSLSLLPGDVFRIKGVLDFKEVQNPMLFQYVAGRYELSEFDNPKMQERFLIFIGKNMNERLMESVFLSG